MAVLKYYNTATSAWEYIAASTTANFTTWKKTMAGGETSVSGTDDNSVTLSYTVGLEQVFINGALQVRGSDYVATTGTSVTGLSALSANDIVSVVCYAPFNVTNTYTKTETDGVAAAAAGLRMVVPTSVAVGSGSGSANAAGQVTFSGVSSVSLNGVFTSVYDNYRIVINSTSSTGNNLTLRMRTSGTDGTTSEYSYIVYQITTNSTVGYTAVSGGATSMVLIPGEASKYSRLSLEMFNPVSSSIVTGMTWQGVRDSNSSPYTYNYTASGADGQLAGKPASRDGFTLLASTGTISGTVAVYGYKD